MNKNSQEMKLIDYIGNGLSFLSAIFTILSFFGFTASGYPVFLIVGVILIFVTIAIFKCKKSISKNILIFILNKTVINSNVEIRDKIVIYEHLERYKFRFQSSFSIKVVGNTSINTHAERLKWTAGFISDVIPLYPNQKIEYDKNPLSYNEMDKQNFNIVFSNNKKIGKHDEPYKTGFEIKNLRDDKKISKPILVVGIYNVTKNLTLKVIFNKDLSPIELRGRTYAHFIDEEPYESIPLDLKEDIENNKYYVEFNMVDLQAKCNLI